MKSSAASPKPAKSLGSRIALIVVLIVFASSLIPSAFSVYLSIGTIRSYQTEYTVRSLHIYSAQMSEVIKNVSTLPALLSPALPLGLLRALNSHGQTTEANAQSSFLNPQGSGGNRNNYLKELRRTIQTQIVPLEHLSDLSLLSAQLGGKELLRIRWAEGKPSEFVSESLNTTSNIPFFIKTVRDDRDATIDQLQVGPGYDGSGDKRIRLRISKVIELENGSPFGVLAVDCDLTDWLIDNISHLDPDNSVFLFDESGRILYFAENEETLIGPEGMTLNNLWPGASEFDLTEYSELTTFEQGQNLLGVLPFLYHGHNAKPGDPRLFIGTITEQRNKFEGNLAFIVSVGLVTLLMTTMGAYSVSVMTRPISRLTSIAGDLASGKIKIDEMSDHENSYETKIVAEAFVAMRDSIDSGREKIRESALRLQLAMTAGNAGIWEMSSQDDTEGYWSEHVYRLLGYEPEDAKEVDPLLHRHMGAENAKIYLENLNVAKATGTRFQHEALVTVKDGSKRWFSVVGMPEYDARGKLLRTIGTLHDIDETKQAEKVKSEFVSIVSHELRTPLTSILGSLRMVNSERFGELPQKPKGLLKIAETNGNRLLRLINEILDLEKMRKNSTELSLTEFPIESLLTTVVETNEPYAQNNEVSLKIVEVPDLNLSADFDRLVQVLTNLVSNACKFSPSGSTVEIACRRSDEGLKVSVRDYGNGIPPEFQSKLFEPFSQADSSDTRAVGGTGLGLAIAKSIVEIHGGEISFNSDKGGTTFIFTLPREAIRVPGDKATSLPSVLFVAANDKNAADFRARAQSEGSELVCVTNFVEAAKEMSDQEFELYIFDLGETEKNAEKTLEFTTEKLKSNKPVLYLSHGDQPDLKASDNTTLFAWDQIDEIPLSKYFA